MEEQIIVEAFIGRGIGFNKHFILISGDYGYRRGDVWPNHDDGMATDHLKTVWTWPTKEGVVEIRSTGVLMSDNHHCIMKCLIDYCGFPRDLMQVKV